MSRVVDFPDLTITTDVDEANHQNYLAWKAQHVQRKRQSITLFNLYQCRNIQRMCSQAQYKDDALRESDTLKDEIERRISNACDCPTCESNAASLREIKERRNSDLSITSRDSASSSNTSLSKVSSAPSPTKSVPSGRNSLITSPPPRSRHHKRRANSLST